MRIAINGFGRIGRMIFRGAYKDKDIEIVAVNDLTEPATLAHLLKYDSVHRKFEEDVRASEDSLIIGKNKIKVYKERDPEQLPWKNLKIDVVIESTGKYILEEEQKQFHQEEERLLAKMRGEDQASKEQRERWAQISAAVGSEDLTVGHRLEDLGFDKDTAAVLMFTPLVEVAWADGKVGYEESYKIVDEVRSRGIKATSAAYEFLSKITLQRPAPEFFDGCNAVIRDLLAEMSGDNREKQIGTLAELCAEVARASRGFFGFGPAVSPEERDAIGDIIKELDLEQSDKAVEILKKL